MKFLCALALVLASAATAHGQETEDYAVAFAPIKGGAVFDEKMGVDGSFIANQYLLTHVTCSTGSKTLRVMLPHGPEDDETAYEMDGPPSTLKRKGDIWTADVEAYGKRSQKQLVLKPVKDPASQYKQQFELKLDVGDSLWKAMRDPEPGKAKLFIGTGGAPISLPGDKKFTAFLKLCGIEVRD